MQKDGELPEGSYLVLPINILSHKLGNSHRNFSFIFHMYLFLIEAVKGVKPQLKVLENYVNGAR